MADVNLSELAREHDHPAPSTQGGKRHLLTRYVLPALLLTGFVALLIWSTKDLLFPPREVTVVPVHATRSAVRQEGTPLFQAAGWIEPRPTPIRVPALAPGVVEELLVVEDQEVAAGEPVARLVAEDARLAREHAAADLALREAELEEAEATLAAAILRYEQPVHLEAPLSEAEAALAEVETQLKTLPYEVRRAEADLEFARLDYDGKLAARGTISQREIDQARNALESARALLDELQHRSEALSRERAALNRRRNALQTELKLRAVETQARDEARAQKKAAEARLQQAATALAEADLRLERMTVRAPVAGRVLRLVGEPGARLMDSSGHEGSRDGSTVVTLYQPQSLQVRVDVRFEDVPKVSWGQPVRIASPAVPKPLAGKVLFISSEADIQKNTLQVKVAIDSPPAVFKPEMLVDVTFLAPAVAESEEASEEELRLFVPAPLVQHDDQGTFVWLADQSEGIARKARVETVAAAEQELVEVSDGLTIASRLIASGFEGLEDGERIRIVGEQPPVSELSPDRLTQGTARRPLRRLPTGGDH